MAIIDIEEVVDRRRFGAFQLRIVILSLLVQFVDGFDNQAIAFIAPALARDWHVSRAMLGPVFSAGAFGTLLGSLLMGPIGDWLGRKTLMIGSLGIVTVLMALTARCDSLHELITLRFLAGLPLGALIPSTIVLANEWSPRKSRAAMVTMMACGFALGAAIGGLLASHLLPRFGWQSVFNVGAIGTGLLGLALIPLMPESVRFLALRPSAKRRARIAAILRRFDPSIDVRDDMVLAPARHRAGGNVVAALFREGRATITLLLWLAFFGNLVVMNFLNNWLPTLISGSGVPLEQAVRITTLFQIGGIVGVLLMGAVADRVGVWRLILGAYLCSALFVALIGSVVGMVPVLAATVALAGFCVVGVQMAMSAAAATLYPTAIRSTGSSWSLGIGRIGSSLGPLIGGFLVGWHWDLPEMFITMAMPALCGSAAVVLLARHAASRASAPAVAPGMTHA